MKKTKKIVYPALVREEAKNLKKYATKSELGKLDFETLDPNWPNRCIYGQMCNGCYTERATTLIESSASRVYKTGYYGLSKNGALSNTLNGSPKKSTRQNYWSPIENFIFIMKNRENGANERLIKYLKGEIRTL